MESPSPAGKRTGLVFVFTCALFIAALLPAKPALAGPLVRWRLRNPLPTDHDLMAVAYGPHLFGAVGSGGTIVTSPDAINWTVRNSGSKDTLVAMAHGRRIFVAAGRAVFVAVGAVRSSNAAPSGVILTSSDGITWTKVNSGPVPALRAVGRGPGSFVAVAPVPPAGGDGAIIGSPDGRHWAGRWKPGAGWPPTVVAFGDHIFVAVGEAGTIRTSPDGVAWTRRNTRTMNDLTAAAYGHATFVTVGQSGTILQSQPYDGTQTQQDPTADPWRTDLTAGLFLVAALAVFSLFGWLWVMR